MLIECTQSYYSSSWSLPAGPGASGSLLLSAVLPGTVPVSLLTGSVCISSSSSDSSSSSFESSALPCWSVSASDSSLSSVSSSPGRGSSSLLRSSSSDLSSSSAAGSGAFLFPLKGSLICNSKRCQSCLSLLGHEETRICATEEMRGRGNLSAGLALQMLGDFLIYARLFASSTLPSGFVKGSCGEMLSFSWLRC